MIWVVLGSYWDNRTEHGNYNLGLDCRVRPSYRREVGKNMEATTLCRVQGFGLRACKGLIKSSSGESNGRSREHRHEH